MTKWKRKILSISQLSCPGKVIQFCLWFADGEKISTFNVHCKGKERQRLEPLKMFTVIQVASILDRHWKDGRAECHGGSRSTRVFLQKYGSNLVPQYSVLAHVGFLHGNSLGKVQGCFGVTWGNAKPWYWRRRGELKKEVSRCHFLWRRERKQIEKWRKSHWELLHHVVLQLFLWIFSLCSFVAALSLVIRNCLVN